MKNPIDTNLSGKVAVVTGAGGVICSVLAKALAVAGAKVALLDLNEEAAKKYPPTFRDNFWLKCRLPDGTCVRA